MSHGFENQPQSFDEMGMHTKLDEKVESMSIEGIFLAHERYSRFRNVHCDEREAL